jgi:hypothetical protein
VIGKDGPERPLHLPLDEGEKAALLNSASILRGALDEVGLK